MPRILTLQLALAAAAEGKPAVSSQPGTIVGYQELNWWVNDLNISLSDVVPASGGKLRGVSYILGNGNYMPKLDGETLVTGNAVLYVTDLIKFGASESLTILPGASLTIH